MTIRMTSQDFVTKKIYVLYVPIILLVIHGFMLMNDIAIWLNFATPLMIIVSAITLIPIFIERTPNFRTVFFYMIGLFLFGIAEAIWSVIIGIFHQLPSENVYLACFYTLPNFCFFAAAIAYLQVNRKYFNPAQLIQDLISSTLLGVGFFLMVFFDTQLFGNIDIGISNVSNFMFLLCNTLIMTILIAMVDIPFKKCTLFGILVHPYPVKRCTKYRIVGAVVD